MFFGKLSTTRTVAGIGAAALAAGLLAGCSGTAENTATENTSASQSQGSNASDATVTLNDGWAKAAKAGKMTAVFGVIENHSDADVTLESVTSEASPMIELHETTMVGGSMQMVEKEDGFVIPAGGQHVLEPGGDHIMLMKLSADLLAGNDLTLVLKFSNGQELELTVPIRDFDGAMEHYAPGDHDEHN